MCSKIEFSKLIAKGLGGQSYLVSHVSSELDILHVNMVLTTPGMHSLIVHGGIQQAQTMIMKHLEVVSLIYNPSYLAVGESNAPGISNIKSFFENVMDQESLDSFFYNFSYDFLWIEITDELLKADWFFYFYHALVTYKIADAIPVVFVL